MNLSQKKSEFFTFHLQQSEEKMEPEERLRFLKRKILILEMQRPKGRDYRLEYIFLHKACNYEYNANHPFTYAKVIRKSFYV
jgi:hypothetical protein